MASDQSDPRELLWLNGRVMPLSEGTIGVEDRGFQFADGVYETMRLYGGVPFAVRDHLARLGRSCDGIGLKVGISVGDLEREIRELARRSGLSDGLVYLQATRGVARRNHLLPKEISPTVLFYARELAAVGPVGSAAAITVTCVEDLRWRQCWIKSIALLPNVLARNEAASAGTEEAAYVEDGCVSECSSSNIFAVIDGVLVTPAAGEKVLAGVTRMHVLELAREDGMRVEERPIEVAELPRAAELFITSTIREVLPIGRLEKRGHPPLLMRDVPFSRRLHGLLRARILADVGKHGRGAR